MHMHAKHSARMIDQVQAHSAYHAYNTRMFKHMHTELSPEMAAMFAEQRKKFLEEQQVC